MSDTSKTNCCETMSAGSDGWRTRYKQCSRAGTVDRNGKLYCRQHDPDAITARRQKISDRWAAESAERGRQNRMLAAAPDLLALLIESQDNIGGDWRERRDAAIAKATGAQNV